MSARPRLLIVKPIVPYPPDQGTRIVSFATIRALQETFDVTVLARALDAGDEAAAVKLGEYCDRVVTVFPANKRSLFHRAWYKAWYMLVSTFARRSLKSLYDCPRGFIRAARELAGEGFDLVVVEYWQLFPMLDVFPPERTILFTHDIDLLVNRGMALLEKRLLRKMVKVRRWMVEQREEVKAYQQARRILALTERDAHAVAKLSRDRADVHVLPFGIDPDRMAPPGDVERGREVLFMGAMHAPFNRDALEFFARSVMPLLEDTEDLDVSIVGGDLPPGLEYLARDPRVSVVGRVGDVRDYLHRAACIVIPLRFGGGLRIRTLEAMMADLPVVCTTVAMAGMDFEAGRDYILADTPQEIADGVNQLLNNPDRAREIALAARERAVRLFASGPQSEAARRLFQSFL